MPSSSSPPTPLANTLMQALSYLEYYNSPLTGISASNLSILQSIHLLKHQFDPIIPLLLKAFNSFPLSSELTLCFFTQHSGPSMTWPSL